jgi:DNA-binding response OmpR family regulator
MTSKGRVLVVDDEHSIRRAVGRALTARGYDVQLATDGEEALSVAAAFQPDLVVLDLNLPALDGLSVCRQLRVWSSVPILVLSVREDEADKVAALDLGADDYLTKPFGIDELLARVRALLRRAGGQGGTQTGPLPHRRTGDRPRHQHRDPSRGRGAPDQDGMGAAHRVLPASREAAHPSLAAGTGLGTRICRGRGCPAGVRQPAAQKARTRSGTAQAHCDRPRHRLPMAASTRRRNRAPLAIAGDDPRSIWSRPDRRRAPGYGSDD